MATACTSNSLCPPVLPEEASSEHYTRLCSPPYELHRAVFERDLRTVKKFVSEGSECVHCTDCHGNTPLHLSVMLGYSEIIEYLLEHKSTVKERNLLGWTPLNEAISRGNREIISILLKKLREEIREGLIQRRFQLIQALRNLDDFYAELKWEFHTWVPLLSRLLPSDICRIYKTGCCVRLDSSLGDFTEMQWTRGDLSFIYNGEDTHSSNTLSIVALDNKKKIFQRLSLNSREELDVGVEDHVDSLMTRPIVYANMSTKPITVTRAQSGFLFFRGDRTEQVGEYMTDVYNISDLILISRKRREHLTPEQIKHWEEMTKKVESGNIADELAQVDEENEQTVEHCRSIPPPDPCSLSWDDYISIPSGEYPQLSRPVDLRVDRKHYKASVYVLRRSLLDGCYGNLVDYTTSVQVMSQNMFVMTESCPIEMKKLLDILEVITPYKHFHKLRNFIHMKLPPGFPVKIEIPMFPTVTAIISLQSYELKQFSPSKFLVPREYTKFVPSDDNEETNSESNSSRRVD